MNKLEFIKDNSTGIEIVSFEKVNISYPNHTHTGHAIMGIVTDGTVVIEIDSKEYLCSEGEMFSVGENVVHSISPKSETYSMISICIPKEDNIERDLDIIRKKILGNPEAEISIEDMSKEIYISTYYMIKKFAKENGLTPHKFQIQCRIRKACELLRDGMKVSDVAVAVGFFDQSHLCKAFKKQMGISPEEYIKSAIFYKA